MASRAKARTSRAGFACADWRLPKGPGLGNLKLMFISGATVRAVGALLLLGGIISCGQKSAPPASAPSEKANGSVRVFTVRGLIVELPAGGSNVVIKHEAIPDYMPAMRMPFDVKNAKELTGLKTGESVQFRLNVSTNDSWIDQIRRLNVSPVEMPSRETLSPGREVDPLALGQPVPEYHLTNELGQAVSLSQFRGQAVALTFIFTRCPLPNFCPRMSSNFSEVQRKMQARGGGETNWHLFSVSFDPEHDTPAVLQSYAGRYQHDPARWSFLTGDPVEIGALAQQVGQVFWWEQGTISHNLRTLVIDQSGKLQKIFPGNTWTSDEMVEELVKAAGGKGP